MVFIENAGGLVERLGLSKVKSYIFYEVKSVRMTLGTVRYEL